MSSNVGYCQNCCENYECQGFDASGFCSDGCENEWLVKKGFFQNDPT